jgi:predicted PurR-regulated permease PerM
MAPVEKYPRMTRWAVIVFVAMWFFLFIKFLRPVYYGFIAGISLMILAWGFLSRIEKHVIWKEVLTFSFWLPIKFPQSMAKDGM